MLGKEQSAQVCDATGDAMKYYCRAQKNHPAAIKEIFVCVGVFGELMLSI